MRFQSVRILAVISLVLVTAGCAAAQGSELGWLQGEVKDATNGEPLPFAKIEVLCGPDLLDGMTDYDGQYVIRVPYGPYANAVNAKGFLMFRTTGNIERTRITFLNVELERMKKLP